MEVNNYILTPFTGNVEELFTLDNLLISASIIQYSALNTRTFLDKIDVRFKYLEVAFKKNTIYTDRDFIDIIFKDLGKSTTIVMKTLIKLLPYFYTYEQSMYKPDNKIKNCIICRAEPGIKRLTYTKDKCPVCLEIKDNLYSFECGHFNYCVECAKLL